MEAAVLKPRMMAGVGCSSRGLNAELEVKKLQELVRKLERQNEQLRTRASGGAHIPPSSPATPLRNPAGPGPGSGARCTATEAPACQPRSASEQQLLYFQTEDETAPSSKATFLDEVELIDLDSVFRTGESEETWLYASLKSRVSSGRLTPLQWSRHHLDHPPELESVRRTGSQRLESVKRMKSVSCPSSSSPPAFHLTRVAVSPLCTAPAIIRPSSAPRTTSFERPVSRPSSLYPFIRSAMTSCRKDSSVLGERTPSFLYHPTCHTLTGHPRRCSPFSPQSSVDDELSSALDGDPVSEGYRLQDLTDVQVMARLQEESLRQDYASTSTSNIRRSISFGFRQARNRFDEGEDEEDDDDDYGQLPPPQPRLTRVGPLPHSHTFASVRDWRRSTPSIPFISSSPSSNSTSVCAAEEPSFKNGSDKLRRSMPNLVRAPSMPSVPNPTNHTASPASIRSSQSFDSSGGLGRLQSSIPSPGQLQHRVQSVGNVACSSRQPLKATAYVSPTIKGSSPLSTSLHSLSSGCSIPQPSKTPTAARSGLPRPASFIGTSSTPRSKVTQPMRSLLTPPKSLSTFSALRDGSWRDGCY